MRALPQLVALLLLLPWLLSGCSTAQKRPPVQPGSSGKGGYYQDDGPGASVPPNLEQTPDALPRREAPHKFANQPYTVFGRTYVPAQPAAGARFSGHASWYGRKFHGRRTASGEVYDMYAMSAAHPTLPIPSYVRVTNPRNARSVVVRVNDRGPFLRGRVIDLSYAAALKLGFVQQGSAWVEVEPIVFDAQATVARVAAREPTPPAPLTSASQVPSALAARGGGYFVQLGAFRNLPAAQSFQRLVAARLDWLAARLHIVERGALLRVRAGPYASAREADKIAQRVGSTTGFAAVKTEF